MRRRQLLVGGPFVLGAVSGCVGRFHPANTRREADRVHFTEIAGDYVVSIRNELTESVDASVTVTAANGATEDETVSVEPGDETPVRGLFTAGPEPYTVSVSTDETATERTLRPTESPYDAFAYTISSDEISFQKGYRPTSDIVISNDSDERVDVRLTISDSADSATFYDIITLPPDDLVAFRDVFVAGREYDATVRADGMTKSTTHLNSDTNSLWVDVERHDLRLSVSER
ncbi:hypothetical protein [Natrinema longum]|uniref:Uncharacterized protein n=1 Tax=Natrinema longum TaxID=370324 RepID=A0A8A2UAX5_9EURY|nr:hypothetical protein [Natrinema longum]MBZ6496333.1 hypothetical protein [Natrinema longum]QSW85754.1 hypothetical protein J0X27_02640 [Natrinema longum]